MIKCNFENNKPGLLRHVTVDAIIIVEDKILLVKRANDSFIEAGKYALPGGFLDRDETSTEGMKREVREETGYECINAKLLAVDDNPRRRGEDRQNVSLVFVAEAGKKVGGSDYEVSEVRWFELDNLPPEEQIAFDHYEIIQFYLSNKNKVNLIPFIN